MFNPDSITKEARAAGKHLGKTNEITMSKTITHTSSSCRNIGAFNHLFTDFTAH